ncbi:Panacea domain-containing protein [Lacticaseibacillus paracasei]|uniref:Panacea domain-containing protein n=1 Tax=Lacticaseibacillus paracasei TaxID=1597 RepID=UPI003D7A76F0
MKNLDEVVRFVLLRYKKISGEDLDSELKLQKLLYFSQVESFALTNKPLFDEDFEDWRHGPVLKEIRHIFNDGYKPMTSNEATHVDATTKVVIEFTLQKYAQYTPWKLRELSHHTAAWSRARGDISDDSRDNKIIDKSMIKAEAQSQRLYDPVYDMYVDEFPDFTGETMNL